MFTSSVSAASDVASRASASASACLPRADSTRPRTLRHTTCVVMSSVAPFRSAASVRASASSTRPCANTAWDSSAVTVAL